MLSGSPNAQLIFADLGRVPPRLGRYAFKSSGTLARVALMDRSGRTARQIRIPDMSILYDLLAMNSQPLMVVGNESIPDELAAPIEAAGRIFEKDFRDNCAAMLFSPAIEADGEWTSGFEVNMAQASESELAVFSRTLEEVDLRFKMDRVMFLSLNDGSGAELATDHWLDNVSWLLGRMVINGLLAKKEWRPEVLGKDARDFFAFKYHSEMLRRLTGIDPEMRSTFPSLTNQELVLLHEISAAHFGRSIIFPSV